MTPLIETIGFEIWSLRRKSELVDAIEAFGGIARSKLVHDRFQHAIAGETELFACWTIASTGTKGFLEWNAVVLLTCHRLFPPPVSKVRANEWTENKTNRIHRRPDHRDSEPTALAN